MVIEPTGGLAMAAAMQGAVNVKGQRVGVIISGGNIDIAQFAQFLA
jgi:threo-3-hydroxy-L-aspartate ammonia-lyase